MGIQNDQFFDAMSEKILPLLSMTPEEAKSYCSVIYQHVSWMSGYEFEQVAKEVSLGMKGRKPLPINFKEAHKKLSDKFGWGGSSRPGRCDACWIEGRGGGRNLQLVYGKYLHEDGRPIDAMKPCQKCSLQRDAPLKHGLREVFMSDEEWEAVRCEYYGAIRDLPKPELMPIPENERLLRITEQKRKELGIKASPAKPIGSALPVPAQPLPAGADVGERF